MESETLFLEDLETGSVLDSRAQKIMVIEESGSSTKPDFTTKKKFRT